MGGAAPPSDPPPGLRLTCTSEEPAMALLPAYPSLDTRSSSRAPLPRSHSRYPDQPRDGCLGGGRGVKHVGGTPPHRGCGQILGLGPRDTSSLQGRPVTGSGRGCLGQGLRWHSCLGPGKPAAALSRGEPGFTTGCEETAKKLGIQDS